MNRPYTSRSQSGFSLLELLAVMSIIATLTTLAVTSYFSAVRGMARRSTVNNLANTLILAHQRACIESACFSVIMFNEAKGNDDKDVTPSYVVCKEVGKITATSGSKLIDEFTPLNELFSTDPRVGKNGVMRLYNLSEGKWTWVQKFVESADLTSRKSAYHSATYDLSPFGFTISDSNGDNPNAATWEVGDSYGIEATAVRALNRHFYFKALGKNKSGVLRVTFATDGQLKDVAGQAANETTIELVELRGEGGGGTEKSTTIRTSGGTVKWDGIWR